ncbi:hypothetical protein AYO22_09009 [Fonsecaea multimorphosa]|nr:hypothetical protein AYO22_09009 [Fonsecaea multimorphosa]
MQDPKTGTTEEVGEKIEVGVVQEPVQDSILKADLSEDDGEVFKSHTGVAEFRALGWIRTGIILIKLCFATGVLSIPYALNVTGYGPGICILFGFGSLTTYYAYVMFLFRMKYRGVHNIADAAAIMGGPVAREVAGGLFLLTWILAAGSGFIGLAQGLKVLANGKACTVVWTVVAAISTGLVSSIRTLNKLTVLTWIGFASIFTAVFIVVPGAAPKTGPFDLGVIAVGSPGFVAGLTATLNLFSGYGATPTFMPVIAEMRRPKSFPKALFSSQAFLSICYIIFGTVVYVYCGQYVASPSLASAGGTIEKISFGISIPGFIMTSTLWVHLAAKFLFVKILRNSPHLQSNSVIHWSTWLQIPVTLTYFIQKQLIIPAFMGLYMDRGNHGANWKKRAVCGLHLAVIALGSFLAVAGTYTTIKSIVDAYNDGTVGGAFSCA